jgi:hypothetical protein
MEAAADEARRTWPLIREVSITSCMSFTAELFFLPNDDSVVPIRAAGFTDEAYKECLRHVLDDRSGRTTLNVYRSKEGTRLSSKERAPARRRRSERLLFSYPSPNQCSAAR